MTAFRLGTTSYILPAGLVENARFLSSYVQDMELVLFDLPDGPSNLPGKQELRELNEIASATGLSYTVHLPLDLDFQCEHPEASPSLQLAHKVIDLTAPLLPRAFVAHLDGRRLLDHPPLPAQRWIERCVAGLASFCAALPSPELLSVENLERFDPALVRSVIEATNVSACVDVGHLWYMGLDPTLHLAAMLHRASVIHLHGIHQRDHQSLAHISPTEIRRALAPMLNGHFEGVLTLEIFGEEDFHSSLSALQTALSTGTFHE